MVVDFAVTEPLPSATVSKALRRHARDVGHHAGQGRAVGPFGELSAAGLLFSLITTKATTIASTTTTAPDAMRIRGAARRDGRRALRGNLLPAAAVDLGSACLAHARFVQPLRQPAGGPGRDPLVPCLRRRAGVFRRPGYRAPC